jgi:hypothetical protein
MGWVDGKLAVLPLLVQRFDKDVGLVFHCTSETFNSPRVKHLCCKSTMLSPTEERVKRSPA